MKLRSCLVVLAFALLALPYNLSAQTEKASDLMPKPKSVVTSTGKLRFESGMFASINSEKTPRLKGYLERFLRRVEGRTVRGVGNRPTKPNLFIETSNGEEKYPRLGMDESYDLSIDETSIRISAKTGYGAMRALETLIQLLSSDEKGFYFPAVKIKDEPRFAWRGLMIDSARHFQPVHVMKRNIDAMAAVKLNILHWHLTEDQGFRPESKTVPRLHTYGSDGLFYTQEEMKEVIEYAADRGIRVMPEFDIPGHATSWLVGHPEIGSAPGPYEIERDPGIFDPTLNPIKDETYELLDKFLSEMSGIFPDQYLHIGGDENEGKHWDANEEIQAFMKKNGIKDNHELQTYFNKRVLKILQKNNKTMMGWDEIFQPDLPNEVVIHSWRGQAALAEAAQKGYMGVLSNGYYIDLLYPAKDHYLVDPIPADSKLTDDEKKRVLGGEATMWSEWVSPETIDSRIWMRTAAIAERFWSQQNVRDVEDMYRRLDILSPQLEEHGLEHRTYRGVLLRRLAPGKDLQPLIELLEIIEPVKQYRRYQVRKQTMLDPLTGLIDAAGADARRARSFNEAVDRYLTSKDPASKAKIQSDITYWRELSPRLKPVFLDSPALFEARDFVEQLQTMADIAEEALKRRETGNTSNSDLRESFNKIKQSPSALEMATRYGVSKLIGEEEKQ